MKPSDPIDHLSPSGAEVTGGTAVSSLITDISKILNIQKLTIEWLAGDGSDRSYYRIVSPETPNSYVLMKLPASEQKVIESGNYDWVLISKILVKNQISAPKCIDTLPLHSSLLIEDFGDQMLETEINDNLRNAKLGQIETWFDQIFSVIGKMLKINRSESEVWCQRSLDQLRFKYELEFFEAHFLDSPVGIKLSRAEKDLFKEEIQSLSLHLGERPQFFTHRDFHSRNIMVFENKVGIIDFQDARLGPSSYDLVSLCFDSYVPLSLDFRLGLLENGIAKIASICGSQMGVDLAESWRPMLLQRQLKAIGSFGFLTITKNRGNYLRYVLPALMTLEKEIVYDPRWPFLSSELIERLRSKVRV